MNSFLKSLIYLLLFGLLHFGYEYTGIDILKTICGTNESIFQHLKMGFFAFFFASIIEYVVIRKRLKRNNNFWSSRVLLSIIIPWFIFLIWYLAPAIWGKFSTVTGELSWAFFVTYITGVIASLIEKDIAKSAMSSITKIIIFALFVISAFLFIWFTYTPPWIDLFVDPLKLE